MYFFLNYLALSDLCYTSTVTPKLVTDSLKERNTISYTGFMAQLSAMHFFRGIEIFILTGMAYDRYVAIRKLLHYAVVMSRPRCNAAVTACCSGGFLHSFVQFLFITTLPFCGPIEMKHYFCDVFPLLELACTDTHRAGILVVTNSGMMGLVVFVVVMLSHMTSSPFPEDKVFALFYSIIMFNPLIYTLWNTEIKDAMRKICCQKSFLIGRQLICKSLYSPWCTLPK
ncbi:Olfactory receptor 4P4 [Heterocephalus glaber]|uniref:Olfactory receptor n=1 Tax=Heterocephalus glaber TaxID=10181 RepID=G5C3Z8_HETGA|nr:Olfactory receptor 4P4 [Heterocephalus glaber]